MRKEVNPYKAPAGPELDQRLNQVFFLGELDEALSFSTNRKAAELLKRKLENQFKHKVVVGNTSWGRGFFARLETDPSTSVEALGDTYELALARLANVLGLKVDLVR